MKSKITDAELKVMKLLWNENRPLSFSEIRESLEASMGWSKSTIQTYVVRLRDKGVISAASNYVTLYSPNVSQQEYLSAAGQSFLNKLFEGSAKKLVASFCQNGQLKESDLDELKRCFSVGGDEQ
jgi:BlaI family penicillinase repressor